MGDLSTRCRAPGRLAWDRQETSRWNTTVAGRSTEEAAAPASRSRRRLVPAAVAWASGRRAAAALVARPAPSAPAGRWGRWPGQARGTRTREPAEPGRTVAPRRDARTRPSPAARRRWCSTSAAATLGQSGRSPRDRRRRRSHHPPRGTVPERPRPSPPKTRGSAGRDTSRVRERHSQQRARCRRGVVGKGISPDRVACRSRWVVDLSWAPIGKGNPDVGVDGPCALASSRHHLGAWHLVKPCIDTADGGTPAWGHRC
jgi:hypothetical protein